MSTIDLIAERGEWKKLPSSDQVLLRLLALHPEGSTARDIVVEWTGLRPFIVDIGKPPAVAALQRSAKALAAWVELRGNRMRASQALRRVVLLEEQTRQWATARLDAALPRRPIYWSPYGSGLSQNLILCWLISGAPGADPGRNSATLPQDDQLSRALDWLLPPGHSEAAVEGLSSAMRRQWVWLGYTAAIDSADSSLPAWRDRFSALEHEDQVDLLQRARLLDDALLCGRAKQHDFECDYLDTAADASRRCLLQPDLVWLDGLETAIKAYRKTGLDDRLAGVPGLLHWLLLLAYQSKASLRRLRSLSRIDKHKMPQREWPRQERLAQIAGAWLGGTNVPIVEHSEQDPIGWWLELVLAWWRDMQPEPAHLDLAEQALAHARAVGWLALADELQAALERWRGVPEGATPRIIDLREQQSDWERTLEALESLAAQGQGPAKAQRSSRLRLQIEPLEDYYEHHFRVEITRVPLLRSGREGKAVRVRSARAINSALASWPAESQEAAILRAALLDQNRNRHDDIDYVTGEPASYTLKAAIGHADVVDGNGVPVQLSEGRVRLALAADGQGKLKLSLDAPFDLDEPVSWYRNEDTWYRFEPSPQQRLLHGLLEQPQRLPASALQRLTEVAQALQPWADLALDDSAGASKVGTRSEPHLLMEWQDGAILLQPRVRPLGLDHGPYASPGQGAVQLLGSIDGLPTMTERNLAAERAQAHQLLEQLHLSADMVDEAEPELLLEGEQTLELLARIERLQPRPIVAWPKGGARQVLRGGPLELELASGRDWIGLDGAMQLADGSTLALNHLLTLIRAGDSRFVRLDDARLLQLDAKLRAQLQQLVPLADAQGKLQLHPLAAPTLAHALGDNEVAQGEALQKLLGKRTAAFALQAAVPATLQAELRDYQLEGFRWLMRMAKWGAGACLADDMGLGKTVQTLALLCERAKLGPTLIVAPTSVLGNWTAEAHRFAPTLQVHRYEQSSDRAALLQALGSGDLLLVSYTLLALDSDSLSAHQFATVVLDEAQAIKNPVTQRARAACALNGQMRVALTGTPIENHLGELWSLMRFLNPGLLGSEGAFSARFRGPIERAADTAPAARASLRQLISGFVLRRIKAQVLQELPPRTEVTLRIEPGEEEGRLQQAMRQQAIERIAQAQAAPTGSKRFNILAELTRLRRGACHPQLYAPELKLGSAKLDHLLELLLELRDNHHRALVFSQFVDYLTLVRKRLEQAGLSYQYLDGSTPSGKRAGIVEAFQQGEGDCFLLSLKAGGSGLNLTAADYVIHLDPWWNPAVEQQASDRAHRIGQTRPVTVYRLVLADSIEERILALHGAKRELMDSVLAEADGGGSLSEEDLLALIGTG